MRSADVKSLAALLREHRDRVPRTPFPGLIGGAPITVRAVVQFTCILPPPGNGRPEPRRLVRLDEVEVTNDPGWVERPPATSWSSRTDPEESRRRGRALAVASP